MTEKMKIRRGNDPDAGPIEIPGQPFNAEAEQALIGALLIENKMIADVKSVLRPEHFYYDLHGRLYDRIIKLSDSGKVVTPITLKPYFEDDDALQEVGYGYVIKMTADGAALVGVSDFALQIRDLAVLREMGDFLLASLEDVHTTAEGIEPSDIAARVSSKLLLLSDEANPVKMTRASGLIGLALDRATRTEEGQDLGAVCKSIPDVNDILGAFEGGGYTVLGGRPSMGKSLLAQGIAWGCAANGHPTAMFSLEMSGESQGVRLASDISFAMGEGVLAKGLQKGRISLQERRVIEEAQRRVDKLPLHMVSPGRATIMEIEAHVARLASFWARQGKKLELVIIDYMQIIAAANKLSGRELIDFNSERMLDIGKRYGCHVIVLSQLSRKVEERPDKRPQASDLKESGRLEEDADNVCLIFRPEYYLSREKPNAEDKRYGEWEIEYQTSRDKVDLICPKVRHGEIGTRRVKYYGQYQAIRGSAFEEPYMGEGDILI